MTSTKPRVRVIASVFALLWAAGMVANLVTEAHPPADWVWVRAAGADDYPVVQGVLALDAVIPTQLETGDRVLRVAERDMRGRGQLGFLMTAADVAWQREDRAPIPFEVLRGGQRLTVMEPRRENRRDGGQSLFVASIWCAAALLVLVRAPASKLSDALFYAMATYGLGNLTHVSGPPPLLLVSIGVMFLGGAIRWPLLMRSFLYFSEDRRSHEGVHRWWPWGTAFIGPALRSLSRASSSRLGLAGWWPSSGCSSSCC